MRGRLESGETIVDSRPGIRSLQGRNYQPAAFVPAPDLEDRVQQVSKSVMQVLDGAHEVAAGLIVDPNGWAITKASLVGERDEWTCRLFYVVDKVIVKGKVVAISRDHDVALMKLDVRERPVAPWAPARPEIGTFVVSILGRTTLPDRFSVIGAFAAHEPHDRVPQIPIGIKPDDSGLLLVQTDGWPTAEFDFWRNQFAPGDVVTHLNGIPTPTLVEFGKVMDRLTYASGSKEGEVEYDTPSPNSFAGDWVRVGIRRGTEEQTVRIPKVHETSAGGMLWYANPLSLRRDAFRWVFTHDGALRPEQCGGPVVDLAGRVVGLNIARADTTRTLAIPSDVLQVVIAELRAKVGKGE
jgi:S1-C subfamily serine protease